MAGYYSPESTGWQSSPASIPSTLFTGPDASSDTTTTLYGFQSRQNEMSSYLGGTTPSSGHSYAYNSASPSQAAYDSQTLLSTQPSSPPVENNSTSSTLPGVGTWVQNLDQIFYGPPCPSEYNAGINVEGSTAMVMQQRDVRLYNREVDLNQIRIAETCWPCKRNHERCEGKQLCGRCYRIPHLICNRETLESYAIKYLPKFRGMKSREERISDYLNKNVWGLFPDKLDIGLSWFHGPTLLCVAKLIIPPHGALQKHQQWLVQSDGNLNRVEDEPALYAYSDDQNWRDSNDLSTHLNEYMEGSWLQDFPSFAFQGNWLQIYLMQCALAYVPCAPNSACRHLLRNACKYVVGIFIATHDLGIISIAPHNPGLTPESRRSANSTSWVAPPVLLRQMKHLFSFVLDDLLREILSDLEKQIVKRDKHRWATALCTLILLGLAHETYQPSLLCVAEVEKSENLGSREAALDLIRNSDEVFDETVKIFHESFTHHRSSSKGLNPLREFPARNIIEQLDLPTRELAQRIRAAMEAGGQEISEKAAAVEDFTTETFAARNAGRLVSKLLLSFCE